MNIIERCTSLENKLFLTQTFLNPTLIDISLQRKTEIFLYSYRRYTKYDMNTIGFNEY